MTDVSFLPLNYQRRCGWKEFHRSGNDHRVECQAPARPDIPLIGGGLTLPGECLKAMALGADAVFMGTAFIWAMTHGQVAQSLPWEPPTSLVFYGKKREGKFDEEKAVYYLENFITSCMSVNNAFK
ncbi:hypothetical protein [Salicibibacter kimchii]|uniref:hypothetical protein n=1 Tax=Salicibibacter kimchii TaxID=2099786 RepID=UPI0013590C4B|nr:hypothetical protein [Salicibibacter kimchii]